MSLKTAYSSVFHALTDIAEVCPSMPVSNTWPEYGCSALKRVKTRMKNRLRVDILQFLLMVSINGQELATPECEALITAAVEKWHIQTKKEEKSLGIFPFPNLQQHCQPW